MSFEQLCELIRRVLNKPGIPISEEMSAMNVPGWDSLQHVVILMEIEAETGVEIEPAEASAARTIGELHRILVSRLDSQ